ncbi:MAG: DUF3108 domain-containing protein [Thermodesulfovibrionales bacterium]
MPAKTGAAEPERVAQKSDEAGQDEGIKQDKRESPPATPPEKEASLPREENPPRRAAAPGAADSPVQEKGEPPVAPPDAGKPGSPVELLKAAREELSFDIYWLNIFVGSAELEAVREKNTVRITSKVRSSPFLSGFYKVEDFAESTVVDGIPAHFRIRQNEGRYRSDKETVFDAANKKITFTNYLKGTQDEHAAEGLLWDVVSGFYYLRTLLLETGSAVHIDIFDSNKFYKAEVLVVGREKLSLSESRQVDTVKVKPLLKSDGLFKSKGDIVVWLTDDEKRIPVMVETKVAIGKVTAKLTSVKTEY